VRAASSAKESKSCLISPGARAQSQDERKYHSPLLLEARSPSSDIAEERESFCHSFLLSFIHSNTVFQGFFPHPCQGTLRKSLSSQSPEAVCRGESRSVRDVCNVM
jgi:hypothetical protein